MSIAPPKTAVDYADRAIDCQFAMEPAFQDLARRAEFAGWTEDDVSAALLELARNHIKGIIADRKTQADIGEARGGLKRRKPRHPVKGDAARQFDIKLTAGLYQTLRLI
jgi:hypothetical protein